MPRRCHECGLNKGQAEFSTTQWSKSEKLRRCKTCVDSSFHSRSQFGTATNSEETAASTSLTQQTTSRTPRASSGKKLTPSNRERQREQMTDSSTPVIIHSQAPLRVDEPTDAKATPAAELSRLQTTTPTAKEKELQAKIAQLENRLAESIEVQKAQNTQIVNLAATLQELSDEHKLCNLESQETSREIQQPATAPKDLQPSLLADPQTLNTMYEVVKAELDRLVKEDSIARLLPEEEQGPWQALGPAHKLRHYIHRLEQLLEDRRLDLIILSAQCNTLTQTASAQPINDSSFARLQATKVQRVKSALGCWAEHIRDVVGDPPSIPGLPDPPVLTKLTFDLNKNIAFAAYEGPGDDESKWDLETKMVNALMSRDVQLTQSLLTGLQEVSLSEAGLNDMDIDTLAAALKGNNVISHLYLDENEFGNLGCESLATMIEGNRSLKVLSLAKNHIKDAGAMALLRVLQGCAAFEVGCSHCGKPESQHPYCHICGKAHEGKSEGRVTFQYKNLGGVAIRKAPAYPGVRLDVDVAFKEILCANQIVTVPYHLAGKDYNIKFFELADGRGWVHDFHPEWLAVPTIQIIPDQICSKFQLRDSCVGCGRAPEQHPWEGVPVQRLVIAENEVSPEVQSRLRACTKSNRTRAILHAEAVDSIAVDVIVPSNRRTTKGILKRL